MGIYNKLRNTLFLDSLIIFMFISITLVSLYTFYSLSFNFGWIDDFTIQISERTIRANMDVFSYSPLQNISIISDLDAHITGTGMMTTPSEFSNVYRHLSHHPSWILNSILINLGRTGQVFLIAVGVIIATTAYKDKGRILEASKINGITKKQILTALCFVIALIFVASMLGMIVGYIRYNQVRDTAEMHLIMRLYDIENLWIPNVSYYAQAMLGTVIHLLSCAIFGIFIGHLLKNNVIAIVALFFVTNFFFSFLILFPLTPFYFLFRVSGYFILSTQFLIMPADNFILTLSLFILYLILILFISNMLMRLHLKIKNRLSAKEHQWDA